jgi:hypothetical protein
MWREAVVIYFKILFPYLHGEIHVRPIQYLYRYCSFAKSKHMRGSRALKMSIHFYFKRRFSSALILHSEQRTNTYLWSTWNFQKHYLFFVPQIDYELSGVTRNVSLWSQGAFINILKLALTTYDWSWIKNCHVLGGLVCSHSLSESARSLSHNILL